jgi:hypothetical protein
MGDRKYPQLKTYFENMRASMSSVAALADARTTASVPMLVPPPGLLSITNWWPSRSDSH